MQIHEAWAMRQGGVLRVATLQAWGNSDTVLRRAVREGELTRLRRGWVALPGADPDVVTAVGVGGCLSCVSALRRRGVWTTDTALHVRRGEAVRSPTPRGVRTCSVENLRNAPAHAVDSVAASLAAASRCVDEEEFLVLLDSVVNLRLMERDEIERLFAEAPRRVRRIVARMDHAESGTETMVRDRLRRAGLTVRTQVEIPGVGRVDMVVQGRVVVEVDSVAHHTGSETYTRDRLRDRRLQAMGYRVVRLTYQQVLFGWDEALADILAVVAAPSGRAA